LTNVRHEGTSFHYAPVVCRKPAGRKSDAYPSVVVLVASSSSINRRRYHGAAMGTGSCAVLGPLDGGLVTPDTILLWYRELRPRQHAHHGSPRGPGGRRSAPDVRAVADGRAPRGNDLVVSVFWSIRADRVATFRARGLAGWRAEAIALDPRSESILDQITDIDQLAFTQYRDVRMRRWHGERIVFSGDAAHATSPQLGQGANLALWDAMCLADVFADHGDVAVALAAYTAMRRRHLNYYQLATRALTPLFQSDARVIGWLRDLVFPASLWLPPLRRRMVRTMAGLDRGIVRRAIPLDELRRLALPPGVLAAARARRA
jgi:hypothetical protein